MHILILSFLLLLLPSLTHAQRVSREEIPPTRKNVGQRYVSAPIVLDGASSLRITFVSDAANDFDRGAELYVIEVEVSDDNGQTWRPDTKADFVGNTRARNGTAHFLELTAQEVTPQPDGTMRVEQTAWKQRQARVVLSCGRAAKIGIQSEVTR